MLTLVAILASVGLAGCAAEPPATYGSIDELQEAFESAGGVCATWIEGDTDGVWAGYGNCTDATGQQVALLSVYTSEADVQTSVEGVKKMSTSETELLVGENWIIQGLELEPLLDELGGTIVKVHGE